jgi:hypothetical protein
MEKFVKVQSQLTLSKSILEKPLTLFGEGHLTSSLGEND